MLTVQQWNSLLYLKPSDFKHPDGLNHGIVKQLDSFIRVIGARPTVLSDFRSGDPRQHGSGNAIDTTWPGVDPMEIYNKAISSKLFGGVGIYRNEAGYVSFHFDSRPMKSSGEPATWGGIITSPYDPTADEFKRRTEYVGASIVIDIIKKKEVLATIFLSLLGWGIYRYTRL